MRASGVLLPVSSLSSKYGIGCFSKEAYRFVDYLKKYGQSYWQILPLGQTSYGDSPYQSFSTFAGNPYFISLEKLVQKGLLKKKECDACNFGREPAYVDYGRMYKARYKLLKEAFGRFDQTEEGFVKFKEQEASWLSDYALFMALKDSFRGKSWVEWPDNIRTREPDALEEYREKLEKEIAFYMYLQYEFYSQWEELKAYANDQGIRIIGDIPIYVALDSSDAWASPELFQFDENRLPIAVAGCPPDGFSATGQLWGNPLYDWEYHKKTNYEWWIRRVSACYKMYDVIRIDHFRGFDEYYAIPAGDKTAEFGKWEKGPGLGLFDALKKELGDLNIIVEDLGYITDTVREMVRSCGFPNMKVLEFAFDARDSSGPNDYLPFNYDKNCVVYTGTHDNETLRGWLDSVPSAAYGQVERYLGRKIKDKDEMTREIIRLAQASTANLCIIPIQDYLILDNRARMNQPSTIGTNWKWRLLPDQLDSETGLWMKQLTRTYGRMPRQQAGQQKASDAKDVSDADGQLDVQSDEQSQTGVQPDGQKQLVRPDEKLDAGAKRETKQVIGQEEKHTGVQERSKDKIKEMREHREKIKKSR